PPHVCDPDVPGPWLPRRGPLAPDLPGRIRRDSLRRAADTGPALEPRAGAGPRRAEEPFAGVLGRALGAGLRLARAAAHGSLRMVGGRGRLRPPPPPRVLVRGASP